VRLIAQRLGQARLQVENRFLDGRSAAAAARGAANLSTNQRAVRDVQQRLIGRRGGGGRCCLGDGGHSWGCDGGYSRCLNDGPLGAGGRPSGPSGGLWRGRLCLLPRQRFHVGFGPVLFFLLYCRSGRLKIIILEINKTTPHITFT
jgi:hypothetical protein